jgi:hypothetical protein
MRVEVADDKTAHCVGVSTVNLGLAKDNTYLELPGHDFLGTITKHDTMAQSNCLRTLPRKEQSVLGNPPTMQII